MDGGQSSCTCLMTIDCMAVPVRWYGVQPYNRWWQQAVPLIFVITVGLPTIPLLNPQFSIVNIPLFITLKIGSFTVAIFGSFLATFDLLFSSFLFVWQKNDQKVTKEEMKNVRATPKSNSVDNVRALQGDTTVLEDVIKLWWRWDNNRTSVDKGFSTHSRWWES